MSVQSAATAIDCAKERLLSLAYDHACAFHPLFSTLQSQPLKLPMVAALLRNYDAHASVLRRLLLKAAAIMPEPAVGYVLENVRNEYGNGDYAANHQAQLYDVAMQAGVSPADFRDATIEEGVKRFIKEVGGYYAGNKPAARSSNASFLSPAITAGAITATELLAVKEFSALQKAFAQFGLQHHIWFNHVTIEAEHSDESLALALFFIEKEYAQDAVEFGMQGVLDANMHLYDGLLSTLTGK